MIRIPIMSDRQKEAIAMNSASDEFACQIAGSLNQGSSGSNAKIFAE